MKGKRLIGICGVVSVFLFMIWIIGAALAEKYGNIGYLISFGIVAGVLVLIGMICASVLLITDDWR